MGSGGGSARLCQRGCRSRRRTGGVRFDTLFGARRFEWGPTGLYGAFARSNVHSVGLRVESQHAKLGNAFVGYRAVWLAQSRDVWTTTGLQDPNGTSGDFLGQQIEGRVRWTIRRDNVHLEVGMAHLFRGRFARTAPGADREGNPTYVYSQLSLTI